MPTHDIDVTVPAQTIKNKDMEITIRADGYVFGHLRVSKGSIDGCRPKAHHPPAAAGAVRPADGGARTPDPTPHVARARTW